MWVAFVERSSLPSLLGGSGSDGATSVSQYPTAMEAFSRAPQKQVGVVWQSNPLLRKSLPVALVVPSPDLQELIAWLVSYSSALRPISATLRVLDVPTAIASDAVEANAVPVPSAGGMLSGGVVGMALEYVTQGILNDASLSVLACKHSALWVLSRAMLKGFGSDQIDGALRRWRAIVSREPRSHLAWEFDYTSRLNRVFLIHGKQASRTLFENENVEAVIARMLEAVRELGQVFPEDLIILGRRLGIPFQPGVFDDNTREDKVKAFEAMLSHVSARRSDPFLVSAVVGYIATRLSPGSLDHWALVAQAAHSVPGALLWYGLFAGVQARGGQNKFLTSLSRRVLRELSSTQEVWAAPDCDIGFLEFEMLATGSANSLTRIDLGIPDTIDIEVLPTVSFVIRTRGRESTVPPQASQALSKEIAEVLDELDENVRGTDYVQRRLRRLVGELLGQRRPSARRRNSEGNSPK